MAKSLDDAAKDLASALCERNPEGTIAKVLATVLAFAPTIGWLSPLAEPLLRLALERITNKPGRDAVAAIAKEVATEEAQRRQLKDLADVLRDVERQVMVQLEAMGDANATRTALQIEQNGDDIVTRVALLLSRMEDRLALRDGTQGHPPIAARWGAMQERRLGLLTMELTRLDPSPWSNVQSWGEEVRGLLKDRVDSDTLDTFERLLASPDRVIANEDSSPAERAEANWHNIDVARAAKMRMKRFLDGVLLQYGESAPCEQG
jgi:hypothetical protein